MAEDCEEFVVELVVVAADTSAEQCWCLETFQSRLTIPADQTEEPRPRELAPRTGSGSLGEQATDSETFDQPRVENILTNSYNCVPILFILLFGEVYADVPKDLNQLTSIQK